MGSRTAFTGAVFTGGRRHARATLFSVMVLGLLLAASQAAADTILYNTGVDASGTAIPTGTLGDPHYIVIDPANFGSTVRVARSTSWMADTSTSAWITPNTSNAPNGSYTYRTTFSLAADGPVSFSGRWATDDQGSDILIDGAHAITTSVSMSFSDWTPFSLSGVGHAGTNTIDFIVRNTGGAPSGLRVEFNPLSSAAPLPTAGWAGMALLGGIGVTQWRRRGRVV